MKKKFLFLAFLGVLQADESAEATLNRVVTSATGFETQLKDESRNMFVIEKDTLENKGYQSIEQALRYIPIVTFSGSSFGNEIDMRAQGDQAKTSVKVLVNRVPINVMNTHGFTAYNAINIEDVESIEVIPGGGAVVYGNGTRGGVINITTSRNPKDYASMTLKGGAFEASPPPIAAFSQYNLAAGKRLSDHIYLKGNASIQAGSGYRKEEKSTNWFGNLEALIDFNQSNSLDLGVIYSYTKSMDPSNLTYEQFLSDRRAAGNSQADRDLNFLSVSANYKSKVGDKLEFDILGYYQFSSNYYKNIKNFKASSPILFYSEQGGANLKGKYSISKNILMFGIDSVYGGSIIGSDDRVLKAWTQTGDSRWANSIYILDQFKPIKHFDLTAGARYENTYYTIYKKQKNVSPSLYYQTRTINSYALEFTPNYKYSSTGNIYAKYERGFITPLAFFLLTSGASGTEINDKLLPSTYNTYELGWKDEFSWAFFSLSGFFTDTQNEFMLNMFDSAKRYYTYENIGATNRMGVEFVASQDILDMVRIAESFSYVHTKIVKTDKPDQKGKRVPYANDYKITFNINYDFYKKDKTLASVFFNNAFFGSRVDNGFHKMDPYVLGDLGINFAKGGFVFNLGVRNIYNSLYVDYQSYSSRTKTTSYIPAPGRSYYAEIRYGF